jgi:hypothetical protein
MPRPNLLPPPTSSAVPASTQKNKHYEDDDEKCHGVHVALLVEPLKRSPYSPSVKKSSASRLVTTAANGRGAPRRLSKPSATIRQKRGYILPLVHWLSHPTSSQPFHRQTDFWEQVRRTQLRE